MTCLSRGFGKKFKNFVWREKLFVYNHFMSRKKHPQPVERIVNILKRLYAFERLRASHIAMASNKVRNLRIFVCTNCYYCI